MRLFALLATLAVTQALAAPLEVIVFPGGFNWPLWAGSERGFFAAQGVEVHVVPTPNSIVQMQGLAEGKYDIAFSTIDNVVAYREGQGEAPLAQTPDFFSFMGAQYGAVRFVARPDVKSIADLKGRKIGVDAATTGYAFVARKLLEQGGLREGDYTVERVGGTASRAEALMDGRIDATILTSPLELLPESKGYVRLANATEAIGPYQAVVGVARASWAREHEKELVAFIRGYVRALDWLADPANRDAAVEVYRKNIPQASEAAARKAWETLVAGAEGFQKKAKLDRTAIATVLRLRSEYGRPQKELTDPGRYIDESYYRKALSEEK